MQLSQEAPQPGPIPVPARLPGLRPSVASSPRSPHPGNPSQRRCRVACRGSRTEPEQEPTPQQPGAGRHSGPAPAGGTAPASPLRDSRLSCPAPAALGPPLQPALLPWRGGRLLRCGATRLYWPASCVRRASSAGLSICPAPSVLVSPAAALWALDASHFTALRRCRWALADPCRDAPLRRGPVEVPFLDGLRTTPGLS